MYTFQRVLCNHDYSMDHGIIEMYIAEPYMHCLAEFHTKLYNLFKTMIFLLQGKEYPVLWDGYGKEDVQLVKESVLTSEAIRYYMRGMCILQVIIL